MANALYTKGKEKILSGAIDFDTDTIKVALVDTGDYTHNIATNEFYSDISAGVIGTPQTLANTTVASGVFDADDVTFTGVSGDQFEAVIIYKDTGVAGTSPLLAYFDTATGLAFTPSGSDIVLTWSNGGSKIFAI